MSGGLNKGFMSNPLEFMRRHAFNSQPDPSLQRFQGVCLMNISEGGTEGTLLAKADSQRSLASNAFKAFYLPFMDGAIARITLDEQANYFFTAALTGCRLIIGPGPTLEHVDGGNFSDADMEKMCAVRSNGNNSGGRRYVDNGNSYAAVVAGQRVKSGWEFYAQYHSGLNISLPLEVSRV